MSERATKRRSDEGLEFGISYWCRPGPPPPPFSILDGDRDLFAPSVPIPHTGPRDPNTHREMQRILAMVRMQGGQAVP